MIPRRLPGLPGRPTLPQPNPAYTTYPEVSSLSPTSGRVAGGTSVTIRGVRFRSGATVLFGDVPGTNVVVVSDTEITVDSPAHDEETVDVTVTNPNGEFDTLASAFLYITGHITGLSNRRGSVVGGTSVSIFGVNFVAGCTITFGGEAATDVVFVDETLYRCTTPAHEAGLVDVVITEPSLTEVVGKNLFGYSAEIFGGDIRRQPSVSITESVGGGVNTATYEIDGDGVPPVGAERTTFKDDAGNSLFAGQVTSISLTHEDGRENRKWMIGCSGWEWRFNRKRMFGLWDNVSATDIAIEIITTVCPGFDTSFIQTRLPRISLVLDGSIDNITVFEQICDKIGGGKFYIDNDRKCHLAAPPVALPVPPTSAIGFGEDALTVAEGTTSTLGLGFEPGYYYFYYTFKYTPTYTFTTPHPSIPIPPSPGYVQLSDQAMALNATGHVSNGSYGLGFSRGWVMYDANGTFIGEGWAGHLPPLAGDVQFATQDVATNLENLAGGGVFESRLSALAGPIYLDDFLPTFSNIALGPAVGGRNCTERVIYAVRMGDAAGAGGSSLEHYYTIPDNTTTGPITPVPDIAPTSVAARTYVPPPAPSDVPTAIESSTDVDTTVPLSRVAQQGYWAFRITGTYQDGTESRGTEQTHQILLSGTKQVTLTGVPIFPAIGGVTCTFRTVYASIYEPFEPLVDGIPDFSKTSSRKVALILDNTSSEITLPFGASIVGGERSISNQPPGIEDEFGPNLESVVTPDPLDDNNETLLHDPPITLEVDITQLRNRIYGKGKGTILISDAAIGDDELVVMDVSNMFSSAGGKLAVGHRVLEYKSLSGVPGAARIQLSEPLTQPILQADWKFGGGTPIRPFVQIDDLESQRFFGLIESDDDGNPSDGVHEYMLPDGESYTSLLQLVDACVAELKAAWPVQNITYSTRDPKTRKGRTVSVDLSDPPIAGEFSIDEVRIDQYYDESDELQPRYNVQASTVGRITLQGYLRSLGISNPETLNLAGLGSQFVPSTLPSRARTGYSQATMTDSATCTMVGVGQVGSSMGQSGVGFTVKGKADSRGVFMSAYVNTNATSDFFDGAATDHFGRLENRPTSIWRILTPTLLEMPFFQSLPAGFGGGGFNIYQFHCGWGISAAGSGGLPTARGVYFMINGAPGFGNGFFARVVDLNGTRNSSMIKPFAPDTPYVLKLEALTSTSARLWVDDDFVDVTGIVFQDTDVLMHAGAISSRTLDKAVVMWGERLEWSCD